MKPYLIKFLSVLLMVIIGTVSNADSLNDFKREFAAGNFADGITILDKLIQNSDPREKTELYIRRAEAYRMLGHLKRAESDLLQSIQLSEQYQQGLLQLIAQQSLGNVLYQAQKLTEAREILERVKLSALDNNHTIIAATALNLLANIAGHKNNLKQAQTDWRRALQLALETDDIELQAVIQRNLAAILSDRDESTRLFKAALNNALKMDNDYQSAFILLSILQRIEAVNHPAYPVEKLLSSAELALELSSRANSPELISQAYGFLGGLYEKQKNYSQAESLTEQAIIYAQSVQGSDLLMQWEWQLGRVYHSQSKLDNGIEAYSRAVYHLQKIRKDIPITYNDGRSSFRETLAPIYLNLADLLLQKASSLSGVLEAKEQEQALLREARDAIEQIKLSEMQDYFEDACITAKNESVEVLSPTTAVVYPIVLPSRLEIILSIGEHLEQYSVDVADATLRRQVNRMVYSMRPTSNGGLNAFNRKAAEMLYQWLIAPLTKTLTANQVNTLVFVPDGFLRLLPIAALKNGNQYLIEQFATVTVPGLKLFDPQTVAKQEMKTLLAGLSEPGPVIYELPAMMWNGIVANTGHNYRGIRGIPGGGTKSTSSTINRSVITKRRNMADKVQQQLALPGVEKEISQLSGNLSAQVLFDADFELERFSREVAEHPYRIIHIASHGFFGGSAEQNFIMTYDRLLKMQHLSNILQPKSLAEEPIELLTLSACQTAEGDDRSPLGLAGVALQSGARSTLGSLWPVSDDATQTLIPFFYNQMISGKISKAQALQAAQRRLLNQEKFRHPFYWSPFILIGNWL